MRPLWAALLLLSALGGCIPIHPGPHGDYDIAFARAYFRAEQRQPIETLSVPQLYAAHRYPQNATHPTRDQSAEFIRRGAETVPFLREQLAHPRSPSQISSILDLFKAMQSAGAFDARRDPALIASIQQAARAVPDRDARLRDAADEIETGDRFPNRWPPWGHTLFEGLGRDFDRDFARTYCRDCDWLEWTAGLDALSIEQLYAVQRFGWEGRTFPRDIDAYLARRGAAAVPFLKTRLAGEGTGFMVWNILSVLQRMQQGGHYDVRGDAELMRLAEAAMVRVEGGWSGYLRQNLEDLRNGTLSVW